MDTASLNLDYGNLSSQLRKHFERVIVICDVGILDRENPRRTKADPTLAELYLRRDIAQKGIELLDSVRIRLKKGHTRKACAAAILAGMQYQESRNIEAIGDEVTGTRVRAGGRKGAEAVKTPQSDFEHLVRQELESEPTLNITTARHRVARKTGCHYRTVLRHTRGMNRSQ